MSLNPPMRSVPSSPKLGSASLPDDYSPAQLTLLRTQRQQAAAAANAASGSGSTRKDDMNYLAGLPAKGKPRLLLMGQRR